MKKLGVNKLWLAVVVTCVLGAPVAQADYMDMSGLLWRDLTQTNNFTWVQVTTVCSSTTGDCSGSIGSVDFTGWTWASVSDVQTMLIGDFSVVFNAGTPNSTWAPQVVSNLGNTELLDGSDDPVVDYSYGLTRDSANQTDARYVHVDDRISPLSSDIAAVGSLPKSDSAAVIGVWLYREVPEPSSLLLLGIGLVVLAAWGHRKTAPSH